MLAVKATDAWWTVLAVDPIAAVLLRPLLGRRRITPDHLTLASALVAAAAGAAFALGHLVLGALGFQVSLLFDCMDGKLAASRGTYSQRGARLDAIADFVRMVGSSAGLAIALAPPVALALLPAAYLAVHWAVLVRGRLRPLSRDDGRVFLPASARAFLRSVPRRLGRPGSTTDAEGLAFTIGPLLGAPLAGLACGLALNAAHVVVASALARRAPSPRRAEGGA